MPPETARAKRGFVAVGGLSVICIIGAGLLNGVSQDRLRTTISAMADDVKKLAGPANIKNDATVDQVLAAAASKLIQQGNEIASLEAELDKIKNPPGLYDGKTLVGLAQGNIQETSNTVVFQLLVAGPNEIDFSKHYRYDNHEVSCRLPGSYGSTGSFGVMRMQYPGVECNIVR
jgi:hypothetical protein